ncbi:hypothetical protein, partial [Colwellia sp. C1TZA3]|uniref:hypothetical protein n=1 Tax=Colwellia sp. C1TZA3 TaxID=2508879 RepID=UPI001CB9C010
PWRCNEKVSTDLFWGVKAPKRIPISSNLNECLKSVWRDGIYIEPTGDNVNLGAGFVGRTLVRQPYSGLLT